MKKLFYLSLILVTIGFFRTFGFSYFEITCKVWWYSTINKVERMVGIRPEISPEEKARRQAVDEDCSTLDKMNATVIEDEVNYIENK